MKYSLFVPVFLFGATIICQAAEPVQQTVQFRSLPTEKQVPDLFRMENQDFSVKLQIKRELPISKIAVGEIEYPSAVKSPYEVNNTVYGEYFRPLGKGPHPAVIVLDILNGDGSISRTIAQMLAQNGVAGLYVHMAYYGPRRPKTEKVRLLSTDIVLTKAAIQQTVKDIRLATAWLQSQPEIDPKRVGIHGTSLGSFIAALSSAADPRLSRVSLLLGGGGLVDAFWKHPQAAPYIKQLEDNGITKAYVKEQVAPLDPITYAERLGKRDLLMLAASKDDIVPPSASQMLWEATGKQKIIWYEATHVGAAMHLFSVLPEILKHHKK
ncbi:MAG: prolyl oligopeptidase family serine peptidase [Zavarzinella sp.]